MSISEHSRSELERQVRAAIIAATDRHDAVMSLDDSMESLGVDSVRALEICFNLETRLDVALADDVVVDSRTPRDLVHRIHALLNEPPVTA